MSLVLCSSFLAVLLHSCVSTYGGVNNSPPQVDRKMMGVAFGCTFLSRVRLRGILRSNTTEVVGWQVAPFR